MGFVLLNIVCMGSQGHPQQKKQKDKNLKKNIMGGGRTAPPINIRVNGAGVR